MIASCLVVALAAACCLLLVRLTAGPTPFDRLIAMQGLVVCAALFAALLHDIDPRWIDAALAIVLIGAALLAAGLKSLRKQNLHAPLGVPEGDVR